MKSQTEGLGVNQDIYTHINKLFDSMNTLSNINKQSKKNMQVMKMKDINFVKEFLEILRVSLLFIISISY